MLVADPQCEACDDVGAWLVVVRLPNDEQVKLCPPCARRVEQLDARSHDWSDPSHPDNKVREVPRETPHLSFSFGLPQRRALTEAILVEDQRMVALGTLRPRYMRGVPRDRPLPKPPPRTLREKSRERVDRVEKLDK